MYITPLPPPPQQDDITPLLPATPVPQPTASNTMTVTVEIHASSLPSPTPPSSPSSPSSSDNLPQLIHAAALDTVKHSEPPHLSPAPDVLVQSPQRKIGKQRRGLGRHMYYRQNVW